MIFRNDTSLDDQRLAGMFLDAVNPYPTDPLIVRIRYSRSTDFSGTCFYASDRLHVNIGRHLVYPYSLKTYIARAVSSRSSWSKPLYSVDLADGYQLALFVLLHEYYHWIVKRAGRNTRQKESMCDRFAVRALVDRHGARVSDTRGRPVVRTEWDFQDLDGFVAYAIGESDRPRVVAARAAIHPRAPRDGQQLLLFAS